MKRFTGLVLGVLMIGLVAASAVEACGLGLRGRLRENRAARREMRSSYTESVRVSITSSMRSSMRAPLRRALGGCN